MFTLSKWCVCTRVGGGVGCVTGVHFQNAVQEGVWVVDWEGDIKPGVP